MSYLMLYLLMWFISSIIIGIYTGFIDLEEMNKCEYDCLGNHVPRPHNYYKFGERIVWKRDWIEIIAGSVIFGLIWFYTLPGIIMRTPDLITQVWRMY